MIVTVVEVVEVRENGDSGGKGSRNEGTDGSESREGSPHSGSDREVGGKGGDRVTDTESTSGVAFGSVVDWWYGCEGGNNRGQEHWYMMQISDIVCS